MKKSKKQKCAFDLLPFHVIEAASTGDIGYYADSKGNADGNAKQTAGTESIHRCLYWTAK